MGRNKIVFEGKQIDIRQTSQERVSIDIYKDLNKESIDTISGIRMEEGDSNIKYLGESIDKVVIKNLNLSNSKIIKKARDEYDSFMFELKDSKRDPFMKDEFNGGILFGDDDDSCDDSSSDDFDDFCDSSFD